MAENTSSSLENLPEQVVHDPVIEHAGQAWQAAGRRVRSVTPSSLMRLVLVTGALIGIGWLIWATRISLIPFIVGGIIAYVALPVVNWLDRVMPRIVAVLLTLGLFLGALGLFLSMLIPVLIDQVYFVYSSLPTITDVQTYQEQIDDYIVTLPEPVQDVINNAYDRMTTRVRDNMDDYVNELINLTITTLLALFNTVSFILGFLVVPAWLLTVLTEGRKASPAIDRLLPDWLRLDFWAVLRIFDRAFGRFIRGQLLMGIVTALLVYGGLEFLVRLLARPGNLRLQLLLAITAGLTQLIPSIGPFLGVIPAVIIAYSISWQATILVIIMYILVQWLVANFVASRVEKNIIDLHPAVLILIIVGLSQFGFWWVLLAAPVTAVVRDLFRYVYGRFDDPPRPAGLLPGDPLSVAASPTTKAAQARRRFRFTTPPGVAYAPANKLIRFNQVYL